MNLNCRWCGGAVIGYLDDPFHAAACVDCAAGPIPKGPGRGARISEEEMASGWYRTEIEGWAALVAGPDRFADEPSYSHWMLEHFSPWSCRYVC